LERGAGISGPEQQRQGGQQRHHDSRPGPVELLTVPERQRKQQPAVDRKQHGLRKQASEWNDPVDQRRCERSHRFSERRKRFFKQGNDEKEDRFKPDIAKEIPVEQFGFRFERWRRRFAKFLIFVFFVEVFIVVLVIDVLEKRRSRNSIEVAVTDGVAETDESFGRGRGRPFRESDALCNLYT
jgi:hypothetical protein